MKKTDINLQFFDRNSDFTTCKIDYIYDLSGWFNFIYKGNKDKAERHG